jgi:hypothetical protein
MQKCVRFSTQTKYIFETGPDFSKIPETRHDYFPIGFSSYYSDQVVISQIPDTDNECKSMTSDILSRQYIWEQTDAKEKNLQVEYQKEMAQIRKSRIDVGCDCKCTQGVFLGCYRAACSCLEADIPCYQDVCKCDDITCMNPNPRCVFDRDFVQSYRRQILLNFYKSETF